MCFAPINEIEKHMQKRLDLQEQIEDLDEELQALYDQLPGAREAAPMRQNVRISASPWENLRPDHAGEGSSPPDYAE